MAPRTQSKVSLASRRSSVFNLNQTPAIPDVYYIGVDVGTGSARACVIDSNGIILGLSERPITRHELKTSHITQSTTEIWNAICYCVKNSLRESGVDGADVFGIGFDATCSLVAIYESTNEPAPVGPDFTDEKENVILWMDHRAGEETNIINASGDKSLKYVGGQMSIEMELPKMKWLKHHAPKGIEDYKFYDLPDFLTHKATGSEARSNNSAVCKQGFVPVGVDGSETGWSKEFLLKMDLPELVRDDFKKLGGIPNKTGSYLSAGDPVGKLDAQAAEDLGLSTECIVGSGVIDAYAGWIGTVAAKAEVPSLDDTKGQEHPIDNACGRLAAVAGTSTCHLSMTKEACFVEGVWGPYKDVMAPGYWLAEGGQSCTGALLAHVLANHPAAFKLSHASEESNLSKFDFLNSTLESLVVQNKERSVVSLARHIFFYGDLYGNRSPIADPKMRGSIIGQSMDTSLEDLAIFYFGACEFIAQQTRQIIEALEDGGHRIKCIFMSGGQSRNGLLMRLLADCTGLPVVIPRYVDAAVVFGSAILGAVASEDAVAEHLKNNKSRRASVLSTSKSQTKLDDEPSSPYTAPTAISSTNLAYSGSHPHIPDFVPGGEDYFNQSALKSPQNEDDSEEEETLSFGSKSKVQADLSKKYKLDLKPLSAKKETKETSPGGKLWRAMERMTGPGRVVFPGDDEDPDRKLLNVKYKIFLEQCFKQQEYRNTVDNAEKTNKTAKA